MKSNSALIQVSEPQTEVEHTVHAINIHGTFFEHWCQKAIQDTPNWTVKTTNYPVEFPPPNGPIRGKESKVDIRAEYRKADLLLTLLIESKKNNPEFVNWVFFPHYKLGLTDAHPDVSIIQNVPRLAPQISWDTNTSINNGRFIISKTVDDARETRGSYLDFKASG